MDCNLIVFRCSVACMSFVMQSDFFFVAFVIARQFLQRSSLEMPVIDADSNTRVTVSNLISRLKSPPFEIKLFVLNCQLCVASSVLGEVTPFYSLTTRIGTHQRKLTSRFPVFNDHKLLE